MARDKMLRLDFGQFRFGLRADFHSFWASGMERAARRRRNRARYLPLKNALLCALFVYNWTGHRRKQGSGVWMQRFVEQLFGGGQLADIAQIHDQYPVTEMLHNSQIMRNEEICQVLFLAERVEQQENLGMDRHIERGRGLVEDHEFGVEGVKEDEKGNRECTYTSGTAAFGATDVTYDLIDPIEEGVEKMKI